MESWLIPAWIIIAPALAIILGSSTKGHSSMGLGDPRITPRTWLGNAPESLAVRDVDVPAAPLAARTPIA